MSILDEIENGKRRFIEGSGVLPTHIWVSPYIKSLICEEAMAATRDVRWIGNRICGMIILDSPYVPSDEMIFFDAPAVLEAHEAILEVFKSCLGPHWLVISRKETVDGEGT